MMKSDLKIESGIQLLSRLTKKPTLEGFYPQIFESGPESGNVIEIMSSSCTSHLLVDLITNALIHPFRCSNEIPMGILVFNTDGNMNMDKLLGTLKEKIRNLKKEGSCSEEEMKLKLNESLSNLLLLNIYDANQFHTTIYKMETILSEHPNITLIIFNSITAFYWSEQGYKITKMDFYIKNLINTIQKITKEYKTVCIYTKPEYFISAVNTDVIEMDYQIHLLDLCNGKFQVNIKSPNMKTSKLYYIGEKQLQWLGT